MEMTRYWHFKHVTLHFDNAFRNLLHIRCLAYFFVHLFHHFHINARRKRPIPYVIVMMDLLKDSLLMEDPKINSP